MPVTPSLAASPISFAALCSAARSGAGAEAGGYRTTLLAEPRSNALILRAANPAPRASLLQVADHIDHIKQVAGIDHVGFGGDFDGITATVVGLDKLPEAPVRRALGKASTVLLSPDGNVVELRHYGGTQAHPD